jgi:hypothetical protein
VEDKLCGGDMVSYKQVIAEVVEGGLGPNRFGPHNPPQATTYPSNNTMVPIVGPLWKINIRAVYVPTMKCGCQSDCDL